MKASACHDLDRTVLAVDVGGTKLAVGLVSGRGEVSWQGRAPTPRDGDREAVWAALSDLIRQAPGVGGAIGCGVGCGGPMTPGGDLVSPLNLMAWRDFPLRRRISQLTGLATWVDNDAKALALGEGWVGTAAGRRDYLSMVVSTGIGAGIVLDGRLLEGHSGNAGHIGHVIVEPDGRLCGCGARGCLEAEASGTAIAAITGRPAEEAGRDVAERTGTMVGRAVATVANLLDLRLATVAGSVALGFGPPFFEAARAELSRRCRLSFSESCRIVACSTGDRGPLIGAAAVGWRGLGRADG